MAQLRNILVLIATTIIISFLFLKTPNEILINSNMPYYGYLIQGNKFGVSVGFPAMEAETILEDKGYHYLGRYSCSKIFPDKVACSGNQQFDLYRVKERWRYGFLYLEVNNNYITAIIWDFQLLPNLNF